MLEVKISNILLHTEKIIKIYQRTYIHYCYVIAIVVTGVILMMSLNWFLIRSIEYVYIKDTFVVFDAFNTANNVRFITNIAITYLM